VDGDDLREVMHSDPAKFWTIHSKIINPEKKNLLSKEFMQLFEAMIALDPCMRATIPEIKASSWYQGKVYSHKEMVSFYVKNL